MIFAKNSAMLGTLTQSEIEQVLQSNCLGRIGYVRGNNLFIVPVSYVFEGGHVLCYSYEGQKIEAMRTDAHVGFEVEEITDGQNWKCVLAQGTYDELTDREDIAAAGKLLSDTALQTKASLTALPPTEADDAIYHRARIPVFYRIMLYDMTGRFERQD